jgi:hypothetical protein
LATESWREINGSEKGVGGWVQKISWAIKRLFVLRKQKRTRDRIGCRNGGEMKAKQAQFK